MAAGAGSGMELDPIDVLEMSPFTTLERAINETDADAFASRWGQEDLLSLRHEVDSVKQAISLRQQDLARRSRNIEHRRKGEQRKSQSCHPLGFRRATPQTPADASTRARMGSGGTKGVDVGIRSQARGKR